jgi:hypothetical protein
LEKYQVNDKISFSKGNRHSIKTPAKKFSNMSLKANPNAMEAILIEPKAFEGVRPGKTIIAANRMSTIQTAITVNRSANSRKEYFRRVLFSTCDNSLDANLDAAHARNSNINPATK